MASIAVLAFTDMSAAKDQDWFCDGIAEEILNGLTPLTGLRVAARTSAFSFKGKGDDLRTIGEKLNVTTVLEGSVRRAGDRVRITVRLSEVATGFQLWSERYDRELKDIFDVQDEIAKSIAERLRVTLVGGKDDRLVEQATLNIEAYQFYLKGRALVDRRGANVPAGLDLHWACGDFERGIAETRRALDSDPLSAYVTTTLGVTLFTAGRLDEAIDTCRRATQLDSESFVARWALGVSLGLARRFDEAVSTLEAAAKMSGRHSLALTVLAGVFGQTGKRDDALTLHRELIERASRGYVSPSHLALTAEAAGQHEEAMAFVRRAWDEREPSFILWARQFPQYRALYSDPRFAAILLEMDSPEERRQR